MTTLDAHFNALMARGEGKIPPELIPGYRNLFFAGAFAVIVGTKEAQQSTTEISEMVTKFTALIDEVQEWAEGLDDDSLTRH